MRKRLEHKVKSLMVTLFITALILSVYFPAADFFGKDGISLAAEAGDTQRASESDAKQSRRPASASDAWADDTPASSSVATVTLNSISSLGDIWNDWNGDFSFLDGNSGDGSEKRPYQIKNKSQLMGLSQLTAMGMRVQPGEGNSEIIGSYEDNYFELTANIDLGGMEWNPIGFYQDSSELTGDVANKFWGHFDGKGRTVSNFKLANRDWPNAGFFGAMEGASVKNLNLNPGKTVYGRNNVAILAGSAANSIIRDCTVSGNVEAAGTAGGIAGEVTGMNQSASVIENCKANVTIDVNGGALMYVGGIAGKAENTSIVDCRMETGDNNTTRLQGKEATVGGILGLQNHTDIYNCFVSGTIGGTGTSIVGGITGKYVSGHMKVVRFEGIIGQSGTGSAGHRGTFIGHREAGDYFRYGSDVAYLFADTESKIAFNICGSEIPDDNAYTYAAHIGFGHSGDLFYSLVQGGVLKNIKDTYYYEELEHGILSIMEEDNGGADSEELGYEIDHFAPNDVGRPTRGYLIVIPQIDTVSSGSNYYDVAVLEARGNSAYYKTFDRGSRGAVAPGKTVTVTTSPNNTEEAKFQMEGVPTYSKGGLEKDTTYVSGGEYTFTMPEQNTEVKAVYKKVAVKVTVVPSSYNITVVEERTGNRKSPTKTIRVTDNEGKLIATYINGKPEQGTQVQPVNIQAIVDMNNDVADNSVIWSIDDTDLIILSANNDEDSAGYTKKSASIKVNLNASFFIDTIQKLERQQADQNFRYPIPDTIYGAGHQNGGVAVLTAATRPAASFEGKPCTGNSKINVTYQVKDKTYVANERAVLDKESLIFTVTRKLTGNRKFPTETILVTQPQTLSADFSPDFFDKKEINWTVSDNSLIGISGENKSSSVSAKKDAKWIQDIITADAGIHENDPYAVLDGSGTKSATVSLIADDMLGNRQTAECLVTINFETDDQTKVYTEGVMINPTSLFFELNCTRTGKRNNPVATWTGNESKKISAFVYPEMAFNRNCSYQVSDDSLSVDRDGNVTVNVNAKWIQALNQVPPYSGNHTTQITAVTEDGGFKSICSVSFDYRLTDNTISSGGSSGGGSGGGGGGSSSGVSPSGGIGPAADKTVSGVISGTAPAGSVTGTWVNTADGLWAFASGGRTYTDEWAFIHNPYADKSQSSADWFLFDKTGHMMTGWFTDSDGNTYYLSPLSDGTLGHMITGWNWITGVDGLERCYYFNQVSDGTRGALLKNVTSPDGKIVNENGEWLVSGSVQLRVPAQL